jgi:predicted alpha/beta hydrolase family esterase
VVDLRESGHVDPDSGHGPWPEGLMTFGKFLQTLKPA